jgi:hypothetical protein
MKAAAFQMVAPLGLIYAHRPEIAPAVFVGPLEHVAEAIGRMNGLGQDQAQRLLAAESEFGACQNA